MRRWFVVAGVGLLTLVVLGLVRPDLIVIANTPTGGDMGAHVLGPAALRDTLLPAGRISGWSNAWFAGFPLFYFYFPLPSLVIVALDLIMPYGVAFKAVTVMGLLATPAAAVFLARSLGYQRVTALLAGVFGGSIVLVESYTIYGGNLPSTMAGMFSYSWSFAFGLLALGLLARAVDRPKLLPWAALALAATALSHILTTVMIVVGSIAILFRRGGTGATVLTWLWGFALAAFWALPLITRIGLTADMGWRPLRGWDEILPTELLFVVPLAIVGLVLSIRRRMRIGPIVLMGLVPVVYFWFVVALPELFPDVIGDGSWKLWNGRLIPYWYFSVLFLAGTGIGLGWEWLAERLPERARLWVPFGGLAVVAWVFAGIAEATDRGYVWQAGSVSPWSGLTIDLSWFSVDPVGIAVALTILAVALGVPRALSAPAAEAGALALVVVVVVAWAASISFAGGWVKWNFTGYEGKDAWPEYRALLEEVDRLEPGRIQWESNSDLNKYGTTMALMLFPYWTYGDQTSMEGLYFESSITTPFHFVNHSEMSFAPSNPIPGLPYATFDMEKGLRHLEAFAVDYYVSFTPEAQEKADSLGLDQVTTTGPFAIYDLGPQELVEVAAHVPSVFEPPPTDLLGQFVPLAQEDDDTAPPASFSDFAIDWYADTDNLAYPVAVDGPDDWPRIDSLDEVRAAEPIGAVGTVSDVELTDDRISFTTTAVGVPHIVKVSYFPNWQPTGAEGPWRVTPSVMVVVPTQEDVVLEFRNTWPEWAGLGLSVVGLVALGVVLLGRRSRESTA
ncbi:MAG: hypothetical protein AB1Z57_04605 [Acidimicrobiia bacterium]